MEDFCTILYVFILKKLLIVQTLSRPVHWLQLAKVKPDGQYSAIAATAEMPVNQSKHAI